ncbi:MAG: hypothetical protein ACI9DF_001000, partial [Verrucomicrobiales bacterium]
EIYPLVTQLCLPQGFLEPSHREIGQSLRPNMRKVFYTVATEGKGIRLSVYPSIASACALP